MNALPLLLLLAGPVTSMASPSRPGQDTIPAISLDQALDLFREHSPDLALARSRLRAELAGARQSRAAPNPMIGVGLEDLDGSTERYVHVTQPVDFLWGIGARGDRAGAVERRARALFTADSARLTLEVQSRYLNAWAAAETANAIRELVAVLGRLLAAAEARFAEGDLPGYDVRRLRFERAVVRRRAARAEVEQGAAEAALGSLVAPEGGPRAALADVLASDPPAVTPGFDPAVASARRAELTAARAGVAAGEAEVTLGRSSLLAGASLTGGFKRQPDGRDGVVVGLQMPLPVLDRRGGAVDAARARVEHAEAEVDLIQRIVARQAAIALARVEALAGLTRGEAATLADGQELLSIARVAYLEGETGILELLDAAEAHLEARLMDITLRADRWQALFELQHAAAGIPDPVAGGGRNQQ